MMLGREVNQPDLVSPLPIAPRSALRGFKRILTEGS